MKNFFLFIILFFSIAGFSQIKSDSSVVVNGKKYCFHQLQKGETLYQLSRTYKVAYSVIKEANPNKGDSLQLGELIKIPCESFGLKKEISTDTINSKKVVSSPVLAAKTIVEENLNDNSVFRLAIMLPFQLEKNQTYMANNTRDEIPEFLLETRVFMDFYEGATVALDSLARMGKKIVVYVYDVNDAKSDNSEVLALTKRPEFSKLNMIIGPAYSSTFTYLANLVKNQNVYLVSPFVKNKSIIENKPKVIKILPSIDGRVTKLAKYIYQNHLSDNVLLCYETEKDNALLTKVLNEVQNQAKQNSITIPKLPILTSGLADPSSQLTGDSKNIVVAMSTDENFTIKLVSKLQALHDKFEIELFGMEEWKDYKNIEVNYWEDLKIHIVGNLDYNYGYGLNESFFREYYEKYQSEPADYAVLGYDVVFHLLKNMSNNQFELSQIVGKYFIGGKLDFQFKYGSPQNGIENKACGIYNYQNFKFVRIDE